MSSQRRAWPAVKVVGFAAAGYDGKSGAARGMGCEEL